MMQTDVVVDLLRKKLRTDGEAAVVEIVHWFAAELAKARAENARDHALSLARIEATHDELRASIAEMRHLYGGVEPERDETLPN